MAEDRYDDLVRDLTALGRGVVTAPAGNLETAVMRRVATLPPPSGTTSRSARLGRVVRQQVAHSFESRRRTVALAVGAVLLTALATPPVRAAVADWFGFGGAVVEQGSPAAGPAAPPPEVSQGLSLAEAAAMVGFTVSAPDVLGAPDGVGVSADRRVVSMSWTTDEAGVLRLDQFDGRIDFAVAKRAPRLSWTSVDGFDALWFAEPHEVALLEPDGSRSSHPARLAGHTLIWQEDDTTLRLEGDVSLGRGVEIAESTVPVG